MLVQINKFLTDNLEVSFPSFLDTVWEQLCFAFYLTFELLKWMVGSPMSSIKSIGITFYLQLRVSQATRLRHPRNVYLKNLYTFCKTAYWLCFYMERLYQSSICLLPNCHEKFHHASCQMKYEVLTECYPINCKDDRIK